MPRPDRAQVRVITRPRPGADDRDLIKSARLAIFAVEFRDFRERSPISRSTERALEIFANVVISLFAVVVAIGLVRSCHEVIVGLQRDDRLYAISLFRVVIRLIEISALVVLLRRRPLGWFLALAASIYRFLSMSGLHAFRAFALGPDPLQRGWLLGVLLWMSISLILLHPRVRHACEVKTGILSRVAGAAAIAVTLTALVFLTVSWDFRASS